MTETTDQCSGQIVACGAHLAIVDLGPDFQRSSWLDIVGGHADPHCPGVDRPQVAAVVRWMPWLRIDLEAPAFGRL